MTGLPPSAAARMPPMSVNMPHFTLDRGRYTSNMTIEGWTITTTKRPILNGKEIDVAEKNLSLPLPEMTFGNNSLRLSYSPPSPSSTPSTGTGTGTGQSQGQDRVEIIFSALDALAEVGTGNGWEEVKGGGVLVSMADKWKGKSKAVSYLSNEPVAAVPVKPHDWTYSSVHPGRTEGAQFVPSETHELPLRLLSRQDPLLDQILFYDDVPLFEDELHDHGESILNARIRVMPHSWFVLVRLFIRVDDVLFRLYDVRLYHAFGSGEIVRETWGMEADYEAVKRRLEKPQDLTPLTNSQWVHQVLSTMSGPSSKTNGKPWCGLGKRIDVLRLPTGHEPVETKLEKLEIS